MFKDKERISKNIEFIKSVSKKIDRRNKRLSLNKIIKFFNMNKEKIINTYSIKNIFLFGSSIKVIDPMSLNKTIKII